MSQGSFCGLTAESIADVICKTAIFHSNHTVRPLFWNVELFGTGGGIQIRGAKKSMLFLAPLVLFVLL